jgi:hypothetical protein
MVFRLIGLAMRGESPGNLILMPCRRVFQQPAMSLWREESLRACLRRFYASQVPHHQMDHGDADHRLARPG